MTRYEFEGRTAAEAAIKACEELGVTRAEIKYDVVSETGEDLDRCVVIAVEVDPDAPKRREEPESPPARMRPPPGERGGRREGRETRGRRGRRPEGRNDRGSRRGPPRETRQGRGERDDGLEVLLDLKAVPEERGEPRPEITGESSARAARAKEVLRELLDLAGLQGVPRILKDDEEEIRLDVCGEDEAEVIGDKGEVLLALQFLLNRVVVRETEGEQAVVLDVADYRERRRTALAELARRLADRARERRKIVKLSPMSAHDRRVFHLTLSSVDGVTTRSEGSGLFRNLLIVPGENEIR